MIEIITAVLVLVIAITLITYFKFSILIRLPLSFIGTYFIIYNIFFLGRFYSNEPRLVLKSILSSYLLIIIFLFTFILLLYTGRLFNRPRFKNAFMILLLCSTSIIVANYTYEYSEVAKSSASSKLTSRRMLIAHAGGAIDGASYTNSLEALEKAYEAGFKLIELDIESTSDGHLVAVHSWDRWAEQTNFDGELPPTLENFTSLEIEDEYSPLTLHQVRKWIERHEDVTIITDKINDPAAVLDVLNKPDRLHMEVFTIDAFNEAKKLGIKKILLSESSLKELKMADTISELKALGVEALVIGRKKLRSHRRFFRNLKKEGIQVYVHSIPDDEIRAQSKAICKILNIARAVYVGAWTDLNELCKRENK